MTTSGPRRWQHGLATGKPSEVEYRLRHHSGAYSWTLGRALPVRNDAGLIVRWIGTYTAIDDAKLAAEQNELLSRELAHRIKNIFAVIGGLIGLSVRQAPEANAFAATLRDRIWALGRAHEFVRHHSDESRPTIGRTTLRGMFDELFKSYGLRGRKYNCHRWRHRHRRQGRHAVRVALPRTGDQRIEVRRTVDRGRQGRRHDDDRGRRRSGGMEGDRGPAIIGAPTRTGFGTRLS